MITQPSTPRLIDVVRRHLEEVVSPQVGDAAVAGSLQMVDRVLQTLAVRSEHEIAWMCEQIEAIEATASALTAAGGYLEVATALAALRKDGSPGMHLTEITARYNLAGEVLSTMLEATADSSGPQRDSITALLDSRMAREMEIQGVDYRLLGRR